MLIWFGLLPDNILISTMKFRYDINALRAIAVLSVVLYHYNIPYFKGGFAGVDVFFVISGYLMSRIIFNGIESGNFTFTGFYAKRVGRIIPALLAMVLVVSILGFFFYFPTDYQKNSQNAASALLFVSNIWFWQNSGYFDQASGSNIFIHTWSLSVEWQFYLLYPLLLLLFARINGQRLKLILFSGLTLLLFVASVIYVRYDSTAAFYWLPFRAWEMVAGGIAFLSEGYLGKFKYRRLLAIAGYTIIALGMFGINSKMDWPGLYTLLPVVATFMVLVAGLNQGRLLQHKLVQFMGQVSYSLYLWHWPVYVFAVYMGLSMGGATICMLLAIALLLAYLSYRYIESFRLDANQTRCIFVTTAALVCQTALLGTFNTNSIMFKPQALRLADYRAQHEAERHQQFREDVCFITPKTGFKGFNKQVCLLTLPKHKNVLLIGDSHAADLYPSLDSALRGRNINLMQATAGGCYPVTDPQGTATCRDLMLFTYNKFIAHSYQSIAGIILSCNWQEHVTATDDMEWTMLKNTIQMIQARHIPLIIIGQNEVYTVPYPVIAAKECQFSISIHKQYLEPRAAKINTLLKANLKPWYIDVYHADNIPLPTASGIPYMFDQNHFTRYGADALVQQVMTAPQTLIFLRAITNPAP